MCRLLQRLLRDYSRSSISMNGWSGREKPPVVGLVSGTQQLTCAATKGSEQRPPVVNVPHEADAATLIALQRSASTMHGRMHDRPGESQSGLLPGYHANARSSLRSTRTCVCFECFAHQPFIRPQPSPLPLSSVRSSPIGHRAPP